MSLDPELLIRISAFGLVLTIMVMWESLFPRRRDVSRSARWPGNFGVFAVNVIMLAILPVTAVAASYYALQAKFGLLIWLELPLWPSIFASLLILDCAIYWQHRLFHLIKPMWKIHRMHHADTGIDVTTALRFHPIEIFLSILIKAGIIVLIGAPILAVILFEVFLNACAMFNHSNVRIPKGLDGIVRLILVTPDMHRVHHSVLKTEHDNNFGFCLAIWDRLFGSYQDQPRDGHMDMEIGLTVFNGPEETRLDKILTQPFR